MVVEVSRGVYRCATIQADAVVVSTGRSLLERGLALDRLQQLYDQASATGDPQDILARALAILKVDCEIEAGSLDWIPRSGPVLVTANHPFGLLEGALLATLVHRLRPDVRILANAALAALPELRDLFIFADVFGRRSAIAANASALKECLQWLDRGGLLVAFPAGEVAHLRLRERAICESPWNPAAARLAQRTGATTVPIYIHGANSALFHAAGLIHPFLRTLRLPRELFNKEGRRISIRIGRPVAPATLRAFPDATGAIEHLRRRTDLLARDTHAAAPASPQLEPIADAIDPLLLADDVAALPPDRKLCENGDLSVFLGSAAELPHVLREIGRLREIAFRGAGEGTGHSRDMDRFDPHYQHLFLWNESTREVAGAYRLAATPDILPRYGAAGLYTSTLFRFDARFFERMGPAIELGRSFVRPEYQKQYAPLLLLWKGIGRYAASRPECAMLFGAASISDSYRPESRDLIVRMLQQHTVEDLAPLVSPRNPYCAPAVRVPAGWDQLSKVIADLEPDGKGVPVLIKQYMRSGGKVLAFNVDRAFSDALDALVVVNLRDAAPALKARLQNVTLQPTCS
ncbi:MAG TPA: lysophospholipid acyltransferase family protein [Candidatus Acidoferrum sp.]|nr:lysophospholipid acyltransferase family protein [Candidatus Acidoferrum sp.]